MRPVVRFAILGVASPVILGSSDSLFSKCALVESLLSVCYQRAWGRGGAWA
jgi:hypothetical protein